MLIPKTKEQGSLGVVLEYKVAYSATTLEKEAQGALAQIAKKKYLAEEELFLGAVANKATRRRQADPEKLRSLDRGAIQCARHGRPPQGGI